ncbi:MAG TPA: ATP-binding protein [Kineosporiaceae bacterium]|nr:ATP-binding protein [Kineosporiaceae bacterium]
MTDGAEGATDGGATPTSPSLFGLTGTAGGPHRAVFTGDASTATVGEARRWARAVLTAWDAEEFEWELSQLLTEVVTNAVLHARTALRVVLQLDAESGRLRCEVTDSSAALPRRRRHSTDATTGRGLQLLEGVASAWGVEPLGEGKTVWFEVDGAGNGGIDVDEIAALLAGLEPTEGEAARPADPGAVALLTRGYRPAGRLVRALAA